MLLVTGTILRLSGSIRRHAHIAAIFAVIGCIGILIHFSQSMLNEQRIICEYETFHAGKKLTEEVALAVLRHILARAECVDGPYEVSVKPPSYGRDDDGDERFYRNQVDPNQGFFQIVTSERTLQAHFSLTNNKMSCVLVEVK